MNVAVVVSVRGVRVHMGVRIFVTVLIHMAVLVDVFVTVRMDVFVIVRVCMIVCMIVRHDILRSFFPAAPAAVCTEIITDYEKKYNPPRGLMHCRRVSKPMQKTGINV
jgi:hypothetical protein